MSPSYLYKIVTVGPPGVGKTSIILRYTQGVFRDFYTPTLGADFAIKNLQFGEDKVKLLIWDLGSQDFLGKVRKGFYPGAKGVVFMFDVTKRESFENLWKWKEEVDSQLREYKCLVVANKTDLEASRVVTQDEGIDIAKKFNGRYLETSVKLNKKVDDVFITVAKMVMGTL